MAAPAEIRTEVRIAKEDVAQLRRSADLSASSGNIDQTRIAQRAQEALIVELLVLHNNADLHVHVDGLVAPNAHRKVARAVVVFTVELAFRGDKEERPSTRRRVIGGHHTAH